MAHTPLTLSRRHVLGDLYSRCDSVTSIPVYWNEVEGSPLGFVSEGEGAYSDSFTFNIGEEFCRKLAGGQLLCRFNYEYADEDGQRQPNGKRRLRLTSFVLTIPKGYEKPTAVAVNDLMSR